MRGRVHTKKCETALPGGKRDKCHHAGSLDCRSEFTLVLRAGAGLFTRENLAVGRQKFPQKPGIFVINIRKSVDAKITNFRQEWRGLSLLAVVHRFKKVYPRR